MQLREDASGRAVAQTVLCEIGGRCARMVVVVAMAMVTIKEECAVGARSGAACAHACLRAQVRVCVRGCACVRMRVGVARLD
eukprot:872005-Pleurochrysis_carterae.AAC.1